MLDDKKIFIKICGLTDPEEAAACAELGADAIGLVFHEKSPRHLSVQGAAEITRALPKTVIPVGVFVDREDDFILERVRACRLGAVQLHGRETPAQVRRLALQGIRVIKALFAGRSPGLDRADTFPEAAAFLAEAGRGKLPGGNAESWDWEAAKKPGENHPLILAGGLSPENVKEALTLARPRGVDISSLVELKPGRKDLTRVRAFIKSVRNMTPEKSNF